MRGLSLIKSLSLSTLLISIDLLSIVIELSVNILPGKERKNLPGAASTYDALYREFVALDMHYSLVFL
jgi:hypothetical protein